MWQLSSRRIAHSSPVVDWRSPRHPDIVESRLLGGDLQSFDHAGLNIDADRLASGEHAASGWKEQAPAARADLEDALSCAASVGIRSVFIVCSFSLTLAIASPSERGPRTHLGPKLSRRERMGSDSYVNLWMVVGK